MNSVFLVEAYFDHYGSDPICVFDNRIDADAFVEECRSYEKTRPALPGSDSREATTEEADAWSAEMKVWDKAHPAGEIGQCDDFRVVEIPFGRDSPAATKDAE